MEEDGREEPHHVVVEEGRREVRRREVLVEGVVQGERGVHGLHDRQAFDETAHGVAYDVQQNDEECQLRDRLHGPLVPAFAPAGRRRDYRALYCRTTE